MKSRICGKELSDAEKTAMNREILKQIAGFDREHNKDIHAIVLWILHRHFGFGKKRLKDFYFEFDSYLDRLIKYYEMDEGDGSWLCRHKLKEYGIDIDEWESDKEIAIIKSYET